MAKVPPRNPNYSAADLWPPGSKGVEFPPAAFHPIYLGNFLCQNYAELVPRVQQYFASKGLLARMVFSRNADSDPFRSYQDKTKLYDCLVYFTRPEDAQDAVKYLHRDKYFGHRLNIFPGRFAVPMDATLCVGYVLTGLMPHWPDCVIEDDIECQTQTTVQGLRRLTQDRIIVQYPGPDQIAKALCWQPPGVLETFSLIGEPVYHQRFVESDVIEELTVQAQTQWFMAQRPEKLILEALYVGLIPEEMPSLAEREVSDESDVSNVPDAPISGNKNSEMKIKTKKKKNKKKPKSTANKKKKKIKNKPSYKEQKALGKMRKDARWEERRAQEAFYGQFRVQLPWQGALQGWQEDC